MPNLTLIALGMFFLGAIPSALITWAACTIHRNTHYWKLHREKPEPRYSRSQKEEGIV